MEKQLMSTSSMHIQTFYTRRKWDAMFQVVASDNTPPLIEEKDGMGKIHIRKKPFRNKKSPENYE